jgi:predicted RNase H-like nuclease (RuvC/YqgF family)
MPNSPISAGQQTANEQVAKAAQMKAQIKTQENTIAELQSRIFRLKSTIRYADSSLFYNAAAYNERQDDKQHEVERLQEKLEGEKTKLQQLQDNAKRAGFGNAVYEP